MAIEMLNDYSEIIVEHKNNKMIEKFINMKNCDSENYKDVKKLIKSDKCIGFKLNKFEIFAFIDQDGVGYNLEISKEEYSELIKKLRI